MGSNPVKRLVGKNMYLVDYSDTLRAVPGPVHMLTGVVFPAPFGPRKPNNSSFHTSVDTRVHREDLEDSSKFFGVVHTVGSSY